MRIHHLIIAMLMSSLFLVIMFAETKNLYSGDQNSDSSHGLGLNTSDYIDNKSGSVINELNIISETKTKVLDVADRSPGGKDATIASDSSSYDGSLISSGLGVITNIGTYLYSVPKTMIGSITRFFGLNESFADVATIIVILVVVIILVSSILRNKL